MQSQLFVTSPPSYTPLLCIHQDLLVLHLCMRLAAWQYLVRTACWDPRATCDTAPRAESISEIHSSLSLVGPEARAVKSENSRWQCSLRSCSFHCFQNCFVGCGRQSVLCFQVDCCVPICPLCMGHLQKPSHESSSPEVCQLRKICLLDMLCSVLHPECT